MLFSLPWLLAACGVTTLDVFETCELDLELDHSSAAPGDRVAATGGPQFAAFDTAVRIDGQAARVIELTRSNGCDVCDSCRVEQGCEECGFCPACDDVCAAPPPVDTADPGAPPAAGCLETVTFVVPELPAGSADVVIVNRFGASPALPLMIGTGSTGGTGGTGLSSTDTSSTGDTGASTTDTADTSVTDTAITDTSGTGTPPVDTTDTGT